MHRRVAVEGFDMLNNLILGTVLRQVDLIRLNTDRFTRVLLVPHIGLGIPPRPNQDDRQPRHYPDRVLHPGNFDADFLPYLFRYQLPVDDLGRRSISHDSCWVGGSGGGGGEGSHAAGAGEQRERWGGDEERPGLRRRCGGERAKAGRRVEGGAAEREEAGGGAGGAVGEHGGRHRRRHARVLGPPGARGEVFAGAVLNLGRIAAGAREWSLETGEGLGGG